MELKHLTNEDRERLVKIFTDHIIRYKLYSPESVHQSDDGTLFAVDMLGDMVEYLEDNNLIIPYY